MFHASQGVHDLQLGTLH